MKKLNLGVSVTPKTKGKAHPIVDVDQETRELLLQFEAINPRYKELKTAREGLSAQLAVGIKRAFFGRYAGITPESSTLLCKVGERMVKMTVKEAYSTRLEDEKPIEAILGAERTGAWFRQATVLKVDLTKVASELEEEFAQGVLALAERLGCAEAVSVSQCIAPKAGFHEARTSLLSVDENVALDAVLPVTAYAQ